MAKVVKRSYDASRRQEQARQTQRDIVEAARRLFVDQGYGTTTVAEIARTAGVSAETVYGAFGSKAALLHRAWDITIGGDDEDVVFHERPQVQAFRDEPDLATRLRMHARFYATVVSPRVAPFMQAIHGSAGTDPAVAEMLEEINRQRLEGMAFMAAAAAATGQLGVSEQECQDVVWSTTDSVLWHRLVQQRGWTPERFGDWLGEPWVAALVKP